MWRALGETFGRLADDPQARAIVLTGAGETFCAGADLRGYEKSPERTGRSGTRYIDDDIWQIERGQRDNLAIFDIHKPVIAQVHGLATAAGCQLVASCDMAVAADTARFGVNGVNIGLFCSTPMVALSRNIPRKHAFELLSTGEFLDASRALDAGLVNRVVAETELDTETRALAETVAAKLGSAVKVGKRAFYEQLEMPRDAAYGHTARVIAENMLHPDTAEGVQAFLEKRPPDWDQ